MTGIAVRSALGRPVELDSCSQSGPPGSWRTRIGNARLDKFGAGNRQATGPPLGRTQHCPTHDATFDGEPAVNASGKGGGRPSILALDLAPAAALGPIRSGKQVVTPIGLLAILPIASLAALIKVKLPEEIWARGAGQIGAPAAFPRANTGHLPGISRRMPADLPGQTRWRIGPAPHARGRSARGVPCLCASSPPPKNLISRDPS